MSTIDLREGINAISEVINNRPKPLREFDQIYMKAADMLLQTDHAGRILHEKKVIFIGDGDSISLCLVHLFKRGIIKNAPKEVHVLDFDERIVNSINTFAKKFGVNKVLKATLYNVADKLPSNYWQQYDAFYTNPPFGASNNGKSIEVFMRRGIESLRKDGMGYIVIADHANLRWTQNILYKTQKHLIGQKFLISQLIPEFHSYHLDDTPELTSCSMVVKLLTFKEQKYFSKIINKTERNNFYGLGAPLKIKYVKDRTNSGRFRSKDYYLTKI